MAAKKPSSEDLLSLSDGTFEDDNVDPRKYLDRRLDSGDKGDRKLRMLCAQVAERLAHFFQNESMDEDLEGVELADVEPAPDSSRLRVVVMTGVDGELLVVEEALDRALPYLRQQVTEAIHRRRAPHLVFRVIQGENH